MRRAPAAQMIAMLAQSTPQTMRTVLIRRRRGASLEGTAGAVLELMN
jgi:hypothetical protein